MEPRNAVQKPKNPYADANIFSKMLFLYAAPLFSIAYKNKGVKMSDLYPCMKEDSSDFQGSKLEKHWKKELEKSAQGKKEPSLLRALFAAYGPIYLVYSIGVISEEVLRVTQPILLGLLVDYFVTDTTTTTKDAYLYAGLLSANALTLALVHGPYYWAIQRLGMQVRVSLCTIIYRKLLGLSNNAMKKTTTGQVNNLMTNDVSRFDQLFIFLHYLWMGPVETIVVLVLLYREIGWACLPGYLIMFLLIPLQGYMAKLFGKLRRKTARFTDKRVATMTEIITSMRVIKMYAWEPAFGELVRQVRESEIAKIITASYAISINMVLSLFGNRLLDVGMIVAYTLTTDEQISTSTIFVVVSFCRILSGSFMRFFPRAIQFASETKVTVKRIEEFLLLEEKKQSSSDNEETDLPEGVNLMVDNITCSWDEDAPKPTLKDISFQVKKGELTAIAGPVGCGKSSLLMAILKELPVMSGTLKSNGKISFAAQQAWVFTGTVRENILFGKPYDERKFKRIIQVCALERDMTLFENGEETMIGERGVTLSGGQKARVNLARALYDDPDIIILDDPLSAVDSEVGRHIFDQCIMGYLADKPRILVTHQLQYLSAADQIIVLKDGGIEAKGTVSELNKLGVDFAKLMGEESEESEEDEEVEETLIRVASSKRSKKPKTELEPKTENSSKKMFKEEAQKKGDIGWKIYGQYFKFGTSWFGVAVLVFFLVGAQIVYILADYWLAVWTDKEENKNLTMDFSKETPNLFFDNVYLTTQQSAGVYSGLVAALLLFGMIRAFVCFRIMLSAAKNLHGKMFAAVIRSPIFFFDTNPTGRIQNRFTKDIGTMDDQLPLTLFDVLQLLLQILGTILLNAIINYFTLIIILPLFVIFVYLRRYALLATRSMKRLDGIARSPVFSHTTSSLHGLWTIRAYHKQDEFIKKFNILQDQHTEAWFAYLICNRWFGLRLDLLIFIFTAGVSFAAVLANESLDAGLVGLLLNNTIVLTTIFQFCIRQTAMVENQMTSTERVVEYTKLEPEAPLENPLNKPKKTWPEKGSIRFQEMSLSYSKDAPYVLKNITCHIRAKEKIGIVGRTGAGKSSLITALFRLTEPTGDILIDRVSTLDLGLHDVRKKISIIPQDPVLFTGSLRRNLDPFDNYQDDALWRALEEVQLNQAVKDNPQKLEMEVGDGGSNFSVGQRQLICLARAVIKQNKILLLDEATANVDPRTDALIQETIRTKFEDCTVLTIAHRLNTIMDSDRIMVMDAGELVEFAHPHTLLQKTDGTFYKLVEQTGRLEAMRLIDIARESHEKKGEPNEDVASGSLDGKDFEVQVDLDKEEAAEAGVKDESSKTEDESKTEADKDGDEAEVVVKTGKDQEEEEEPEETRF